MEEITLKVADGELLTEAKIMNWFFSCPEKEVTLNELCKLSKVSKSNVSKTLNKLIVKGLVLKTPRANLWRLRANTSSVSFQRKKIAWNLNLVSETGIVELVRQKYPQTRVITLFGSYRKGDDISTSDIDIAVIAPNIKETEISTIAHIQKLGHRTNVSVNLHLCSYKTVDINLFSNIVNGIVLSGFLEAKT